MFEVDFTYYIKNCPLRKCHQRFNKSTWNICCTLFIKQ